MKLVTARSASRAMSRYPSALSKLATGPAELEIVSERDVDEVSASGLPGVVVPGDDLLRCHVDRSLVGLVLYLLRHRSAAKLLAGPRL